MITRVGLAPRKPGTSFREFQRHWREEHATVASAIPGLVGYVQNHAVLDPGGRPLLPYAGFDACSETVFESLESMDAGFASAAYQGAVRDDEKELIDQSRLCPVLCEREVLDDGAAITDGVKLLTFLRAHPLTKPAELADFGRVEWHVLMRDAGAMRHELLVPSPGAHVGLPLACDLVDLSWFPDTATALEFVNGPRGAAAESALAGRAFGRERLLATVRVVREIPEEGK